MTIQRIDVNKEQEVLELKRTVKQLQKSIRQYSEEQLSANIIKKEILELSESIPIRPRWLLTPHKKSGSGSGVPTLLLSDWHWGEIVDPAQIGGVNSYNMTIAHHRAGVLIESAIHLLKDHVVNPNYPGLVVALGGDLLSGNIHEELVETNEKPLMPVMMDILGVLIFLFENLLEHFDHIYAPAVVGNHGRSTKKPIHKNRAYTSYDWLIYQLLARHFQKEKRIIFDIGDGADVPYSIYSHGYVLSHGDQFRGGDGMVGSAGPILRGDHKKRSRNMEIGQPYTTLVLGHWHQMMFLRRVIVNGSLVGYSEYPWIGNFPYEPPQQAMWLTHPNHGVTFTMPVLVAPKVIKKSPWVSFPQR